MRIAAALGMALLLAQDPEPGKTVVKAVDKLTQKLTVLKGTTQVVWLIDASASMKDDRQALADRIGKVFEGVPKENRLSMAVATFSNKIHRASDFVSDPARVRQAILDLKGGGSGHEQPFSAAEEASQWFSAREHNLLVIVTDERGDDIDRLDEVLDVLRNNTVNVFVVGPEAPFQWPQRYERDPQSGDSIPTHAGPESLGYETLVANPICCSQRGQPGYGQVYPGCRRLLIDPRVQEFAKLHANVDPLKCDLIFDDIPSGYGPWGLSRLAARTGGEYLTTGTQAAAEYAPDWNETPSAYRSANSKYPLRKAVTEVVAEFHKAGSAGLVSSSEIGLAGGQPRAAERLDSKVTGWIERLGKAPQGSSNRWAANRALVRLQLLAMRHYLEEYALAFKEDLAGAKGSHCQLVPGPPRGKGEHRKAAADAAEAMAAAHPGTAWAATARRIASQLGGFKVVGFTPSAQPVVPPAPR